MAAALHKVLYTRQKVQKNKRWADGFLRASAFGQLVLLDENRVELDSTFSGRKAVELGDTIEFDRYLVEVDELDEGAFREQQQQAPPTQQASQQLLDFRRGPNADANRARAHPGLAPVQTVRGALGSRRGLGLRPAGSVPLHPRSENSGPQLRHVASELRPLHKSGGGWGGAHAGGATCDAAGGHDAHWNLDPEVHSQDIIRESGRRPQVPPKEYEGSSVQRGRMEWTEEAALRQMTQNRNLQPAPVRKAPRSTNAILALLGMPDSEPSEPSTMDQQMPPKGSCQADRTTAEWGRAAQSHALTAGWDKAAQSHSLRDIRPNPVVDDHGMEPETPGDNHYGFNVPGERIHSSSFVNLEIEQQQPHPPVEANPDSRKGFLALRDHDPERFSVALPVSKRPKLASGPLSFTTPRSMNSWGPAGGRADKEHEQFQSLREENQAHLKHDREVQARFKAAAAEKRAREKACGLPAVVQRPAGGIVFPNSSEVDSIGLERQMRIPDILSSPAAYKSTFIAALEEEINIRLSESAAGLWRVLRELSGANNGTLVLCKCTKPATCATVKKEGPNHGRLFFTCRNCNFFQWADQTPTQGQNDAPGQRSSSLAEKAKVIDLSTPPNLQMLRQRQQNVFACQVISTDRKDFQQINARKKMGQADAGSKRETRTCLKWIEHGQGKVPGCSKDDCWIISSSPFFTEDRTATTVIATSSWWGADSDNNVELTPLVGQLAMLKNRNSCYAFKSINISCELDMLHNLKEFSPPEVPLLPALLTGGTRASHAMSQALPLRKISGTSIEIDESVLQALVQECEAKHRLNEEQTQVIQDIARTILYPEASPPVILVQGVFGSGKSTLLVAVISFLLEVFDKAGVPPGAQEGRILISAATNVAVDNILLGLLNNGLHDFIRIGCLPKIAKPILTRTLKESVGSEEKVDAESLKDLNEMLSKTNDKREVAQIRAAIAECRAGKMREMKRALNHIRVVGVTCASTRNETLQGQKFGFLILDECSQFIEPLSFLPIARFSCRVLIGAGDPKQLPPVLAGQDSSDSSNVLSKTLFSRLANTGVEPVLLKRQYRCHPVLGTLASDLFYDSKLVNGVSVQDRSPLVKNWPALLFFNSSGREAQQNGGSFANVQEADFIIWLVKSLSENGVSGGKIGIICFYKAQEIHIREALQTADSGCGVQVSSVDAFQGGEKEIIIVSCCRTSGLGFTASRNRMNVAITRARRHLVVVGDSRVMAQDQHWKTILGRANTLPGGRRDAGKFKASSPDLSVCPVVNEEEEVNKTKDNMLDCELDESSVKFEPERKKVNKRAVNDKFCIDGSESEGETPTKRVTGAGRRRVLVSSDEEAEEAAAAEPACPGQTFARCPAAVEAVVENGDRESEEEEEDIFAPRPLQRVEDGTIEHERLNGDSKPTMETDSDREREDEDEAALLAHLATEGAKVHARTANGCSGQERDGVQFTDTHENGAPDKEAGVKLAAEPARFSVNATPQSDKLAALSSPETLPGREHPVSSDAFSSSTPNLSPHEKTSHSTAIGHHQVQAQQQNTHLPMGSIPAGVRPPTNVFDRKKKIAIPSFHDSDSDSDSK